MTECGIVGFPRSLAAFLGPAAGGVRVIEIDFALGDARFDVVEVGVEHADLTEVTAFEGFELGAELGKLGFALSERDANGGELLALVEDSDSVRGLLEDDFGWHAVPVGRTYSLTSRALYLLRRFPGG
jgi:hypothetical protein